MEESLATLPCSVETCRSCSRSALLPDQRPGRVRGSKQASTHAKERPGQRTLLEQQRTNQQLPHVGLVAQVAVDFLQPAADALKASFAGDVIDENNPVGPVEERF